MTQSPEGTKGRGMLLGGLRTAGARDFVASANDLATLVSSARDLIASARDIVAITRDLVSAYTKNGHDPPAAFAVKGHEPSADFTEEWWRSALVPASLVAGAFVVHAMPPYASFDRSKSRIPINPDARWHYPALVAHVASGAVAITTAAPQLWTWLRVEHPRLHRRIGKVYVYGGVVPSALLALAVTPFAAGPAGDALVALGWLHTTLRGQQLARKHYYAGHRRWMLYSYALCCQVIWGRILIFVLSKTAPRWLEENWGLVLETASWIGAAINLIAAQWWYERTLERPILGVTTGTPAARDSG